MATRNSSTSGLAQPTFDFGDVPATPPAHIWALKALRNQFLGTRPSPLVTPMPDEDDIDEISLPAQPSPSSPSKAGILKTPGTLSRRKSVTFNNKESQAQHTSEPSTTMPDQPNYQNETPQGKRTGILARNFPGKYPSPYTPRTRHSTPEPSRHVSSHHHHTTTDNDETDVISISRSAAEALASHAQLLSETNTRLQEYISSGELTYKTYSPYAAHPDLETMKRELEREKQVLKGLFEDFEHQQSEMQRREQQLDTQYRELKLQMQESHAFQSSTAQILEDYSQKIQELNQVIRTNESRHQKELNEVQAKAEVYEDKWRNAEAELDDARDKLRGHEQETLSKDAQIFDGQERIKRLQKQLAQVKMETLEARIAPSQPAGKEGSGEWGTRFTHRRTTSRRTVSATYPTTTSLPNHKPAESNSSVMEPPQPPKLADEIESKPTTNLLSPRNLNVEEPVSQPAHAPGQDVLARRAAAAKRLEERQRNRERIGKENSWLH